MTTVTVVCYHVCMTTTTVPTATYRIPAHRVQDALQRIEKANRRAARNGLPAYRVTIAEGDPAPVYHDDDEYEVIDGRRHRIPSYFLPVTEVTVSGIVPHIGGWTFVGLVEVDECAGVVTRQLPGTPVELSFAEFRSTPTRCQHCNLNRDRARTFVLRHDDGRMMQVGSSCLAVFLGLDASLHDLDVDSLDRALREMADDVSGAGAADGMQPVDHILRIAVAIVAQRGYTSRDASGPDRPATADLVKDVLSPWQAHLAVQLAGSADPDRVAAVAAYARSIDGDSEYATNLRNIASQTYVTYRNIGILASAVTAYDRHVERGLLQAAMASSRHLGEVKARIGFANLTVVRISTVPVTAYSYHAPDVADLIKFVDPFGNVLVWKTSASHGLAEGDTVNLVGTVKMHREWRGVNETWLTNCTSTPR